MDKLSQLEGFRDCVYLLELQASKPPETLLKDQTFTVTSRLDKYLSKEIDITRKELKIK